MVDGKSCSIDSAIRDIELTFVAGDCTHLLQSERVQEGRCEDFADESGRKDEEEAGDEGGR